MYCSVDSTCMNSSSDIRHFLTREEKIELLKEYKAALEKEAQGVSERISDLEKEN